MEIVYNQKKIQNHGLIHGSMLYSVKSYKFCQSNHIFKLNKKDTWAVYPYFLMKFVLFS